MRILTIVLASLLVECECALEDALSQYDTLHSVQLTHKVVKRSVEGHVDTREVAFDVLGRHFHLRLKKKKLPVTRSFRVTTVGADGAEKDATKDINNFFFGHDLANPDNSTVSMYFEEDNTITATIEEPDESYTIEPSWRHIDGHHNYMMIVYRRSDLHMERDLGSKFCGGIRVEDEGYEAHEDHDEDEHDKYVDEHLHRERRQTSPSYVPYTPAKNSCPLYLVADYRFFQNMGESNVQKTTSYLLHLVDRIDQIYRKTLFSQGFIGMGFEVKEIKIFEAESAVAGGGLHFNTDRDWDTKELLEAFSEDRSNVGFCLGHLFTAIKFTGGTLGLSYVASRFYGDPGGICSHQAYYKGGRQLYLNTGWSSSLNRYNRRLLTDEALLVTTHEFGHNWGSEHDPDTDECSPNAFSGGKHIMYTYSVSGYEANNKVFSNCSRRNIGAVLKNKAPNCFKEASGSFCGNSGIEPDEECDAGPKGKQGLDSCCNEFCLLRSGAQCSDSNHECCFLCRFMPQYSVCHEEQELSCEKESTCDGASGTCPRPLPKSDNTTCLNRGKCRDGVCMPFCESEGKLSCLCDNETESCLWCCKDRPGSACKPHPNKHFLPNGTSCVIGSCNEVGVCNKQEQDLIQRLWDVIENITPSKFVEFMRANIVGTVIVFSLVIWIPVSCTVCYFDRKKKREDEEHRKWLSNENHNLLLENDRRIGVRIRNAEVRSRRPGPMHINIPRDTMRGMPHEVSI